MSLEDLLLSWTKRASDTEEAQCEAAERAIKRAIANSAECASLNITVFAQGSWMANTNVKKDSDVDVNIRLNSTIYYNIPSGTTASQYGLGPPLITFAEYKNILERALCSEFGSARRGDKAFFIQENTYRVHADAVPTWLYRSYNSQPNEPTRTVEGVSLVTDSGTYIINYPLSALQNGIVKNARTGRRYKKAVRIMKRFRNHFRDKSLPGGNAPSFQIESLLYNLPDGVFSFSTWTETIKQVIKSAYALLQDQYSVSTLVEVNEVKKLFDGQSSSWKASDAQTYLEQCWKNFP